MDIPFAGPLLAWYVRRLSNRRPVRPLVEFKSEEVRRILLVLTTGIGDAIFSSAVFSSIRQSMPRAEIALLCRSSWGDLFADDPNLDVVIPYPGKFRSFFRVVRSLRAFSPDLAVVLHGNDPDVIPLCYLAGSQFIVRIPTTGTRFRDLLSNRARHEDESIVPGLHYVDNRVRILNTLGIPILKRSPAICVDSGRIERIAERLSRSLGHRHYWVLHIHAADPYKTVPMVLAEALIKGALRAFPDYDVVLTGGPNDRAALLALAPKSVADRVFVAAGEFNLADTAACLAGASAVVGPDTGVLHLAAALDRPVVGLFAPTKAAFVGPRSPSRYPQVIEKPLTCDPCMQKKCPHLPVKCMAQFESGEVLAALARSLAL